jgi:hypothetical protein
MNYFFLFLKGIESSFEVLVIICDQSTVGGLIIWRVTPKFAFAEMDTAPFT